MKKLLALLFLLPCLCAFAQSRMDDSVKQVVLAQTYRDPEYKKVVADVAEVKKNIQMAHKGQLKADYVVKDYNTRLGLGMGKKQTLAEVENRINTAGNKFIKYMLLITSSRIAKEKAKQLDDSIATLKKQPY